MTANITRCTLSHVTVKMESKKGLTLIELIVAIVILGVLAALSVEGINNALQYSRQRAAKAQIANISVALEKIKDDTGLYPVCLSDIKETLPPPGFKKGWSGPYADSKIPLDPWRTAYFYQIPPTDIFPLSPPLVRGTGSPRTDNIAFEAVDGRLEGTIRIENYGVAAARVYINGDEIVQESAFRVNPQPQIIERDITLLEGGNMLTCWIRAIPARYFIVYLSGFAPTDKYFILGSYGKGGMKGGRNFEKDITWQSNVYPNLLASEEQ